MFITHSRFRLRSLALLALVACASGVLLASTQSTVAQTARRPGVRLRSFLQNATGSLYFNPSPTGGVVRVTALGLPTPETVTPTAHAYVVWSVAPGEKPQNVGELHVDESGNGGLEFSRPANFDQYSVLVTAESTTTAENPLGVMALASAGGAVTAAYGEKKNSLTGAHKRSLERELSSRSSAEGSPFNVEVADIVLGNDGRLVQLQGNEATPGAYGLARIAARDASLYLHTIIKDLPLPSTVGANTYVLWGIVPNGRITYMGSVPSYYHVDADEYVRVGGFNSSDLDLAITAETRRPAISLSGLRALSSTSEKPDAGPAFGAVSGRVLDSSGEPIAGAVVEVRPMDQPLIPRTTTDREGKFFLDGVPAGTHMIYASKESDGYPTAFMAFFGVGNSAIPQVTVDNNLVTEDVEVRLGTKAGSLIGEVMDAATRKPVEGAEIVLTRDGSPDKYFSFGPDQSGGFQRLIPSLPFTMKVSAAGYEDWYYGKETASGHPETIEIAPSASKRVTVLMRHAKAEAGGINQ